MKREYSRHYSRHYSRTFRFLARLAICAAASNLLAACDGMGQSVRDASVRQTPSSAPLNASRNVKNPNKTGGLNTIQGFHNFGDPNFRKLIRKMRALQNRKAPAGTVLRIVQFGDSHTASDTITSGLRQLLQERFGDAGIGWIAPMKAPGQYHGLVKYESQGWELSTSRYANDVKQKIFPLGGYIATPTAHEAAITVIPRNESPGLWKTRLSIKQWKAPLTLTDARKKSVVIEPVRPFGIWRDVAVNTALRLPITIHAASPDDVELGGLWLEKNRASGVTVSAIGINGVTLKNWEYWSTPHQWTDQLTASQSDLVIIAYGTNEALHPDLDIADMKSVLRKGVRTVREALPDSAIVIVGAPDAIHAKEATECGERLFPKLLDVKRVQLEIAKEARTLFWDWQAAMGGPCAMDNWLGEGLAKEDLVHLSPAGYRKSAEIFHDDLMALIGEETP